ncbi:MAG: nuclear transport factor 2 family protein [Ilumatobacter sp.]|uniref:nuclear transport factor 2 family protein n=1 Tax=Ilumatobacter sp. TaxID=1967498 RepID=UPI00391DB42E
MSDPAIEVALAYLRALGGDDPDAVADLVSVDFRNEHHAELGSGCVGQDEYRRRLPGFFATFPNRRYEVTETAVGALVGPHADGSERVEVIVRYRFGADADDVRIDIPGVMWISVEHGAVVRRLDTWDSLTYLRQTGQDPTA